MCAGFKAGTGDAHQLINETDEEVVYLEIGDRTAGDAVTYPDDDLAAVAHRRRMAVRPQGRDAVLSGAGRVQRSRERRRLATPPRAPAMAIPPERVIG